jgi:hypothetical protein
VGCCASDCCCCCCCCCSCCCSLQGHHMIHRIGMDLFFYPTTKQTQFHALLYCYLRVWLSLL